MSDELVHIIVADALFPALCVVTLIVGYIFFLRPALRQNPALKDLYDAEEGYFAAINAKLGGLKQKLTTIFVSLAGFLVLMHDEIAPFAAQVGVDPSLILPKVPVWAWPLLSIGILWLVQYFRELSDRQARANAEALLNAGHVLAAPAPGIPVDTLPSPSPLAALPDKAG